jgi:hypothetical protein
LGKDEGTQISGSKAEYAHPIADVTGARNASCLRPSIADPSGRHCRHALSSRVNLYNTPVLSRFAFYTLNRRESLKFP